MVLCLVGAALALGWDWLYLRQVSAPMEALVGSRQTLTMTLAEYPVETSFGTKVTVQAEGLPGKLAYYGDSTLFAADARPADHGRCVPAKRLTHPGR